MVAYTKPWLSVDEQIARLASRGVEIGSHERAVTLLQTVGYYRLAGYLYPFRHSERHDVGGGETRIRVLSEYRSGTSISNAAQIIDFDRQLRMLVLDGVERVEVALRTQVGHVLGRISPFAHLDPDTFTPAFTERAVTVETGETRESKHEAWVNRVDARRAESDEAFVAHFRGKYDDQMPIWALTEILELGHIARLYRGLARRPADEIARFFMVPTKSVMTSWLASLNYVRNAAAHHARLYNRKLQYAPSRPKKGAVPLLDHLRDENTAKEVHGLYNALAVIAYLMRSIDSDAGWDQRLMALIATFPSSTRLSITSMGIPPDWTELDLWCGTARAR